MGVNPAVAEARALLRSVTPLETDCGRVCNRRCCAPPDRDSPWGMRLFPGEVQMDEETLSESGFSIYSGNLAVCSGRCRREQRPLSCRLFPLFPYLTVGGRIRAVYDPRAYRICPLVRQASRVPLRREFVRLVRRAGRILAGDGDCRAFLESQSREIDEFNRFLRLEAVRPPICRRPVPALLTGPAATRKE